MSNENTLNGSKSQFSLQELMDALADTEAGERPVERWAPDYCGEMDLIIRSDGTWWHEGSRITRRGLVDLFASVLRKDEDGRTYLVTPVEKLGIQVERAHFIGIRVDVEGAGEAQRIFLTTNLEDVVEIGPDNPLHVTTDAQTMEPDPRVIIRGRLDAALARPVFYELVEHAVEQPGERAPVLGVWAGGAFFPLGPEGAHDV